ncbi:hypothetical protein [Streptomyces sp. NPDC058308]|uniref:hypothetical protein n=1 Tax=Streptomyces sp. NPDC058308 TaxID=3346440 RepID=UPI0036F0AB80
MVTSQHEASHRIFQERPELLEPVFRILGVALPERPTVEVITTDVTETRPIERRIDTLLRVSEPNGRAFLLVIEAQQRRDPEKALSWGYYLSYLPPWDWPATGRRSITTGNYWTRAWGTPRPEPPGRTW